MCAGERASLMTSMSYPQKSRPPYVCTVSPGSTGVAHSQSMAPPHSAATSPPVVSDLVTVHPLVIIGAGRAALAVVSRLPTHMLAGTTGTRVFPIQQAVRASVGSPRDCSPPCHTSATVSSPTVLDTHGEWLHAWASRLKKCGAEHVRVPCTGTPLPQPLGLQAFATATKRTVELQRSSPRVVPVPSVQLYADYIAHVCSAPGAATRAVTMRKGTVTALVRCKSRLVVAILQLQPDTDTLHVHCIECAW